LWHSPYSYLFFNDNNILNAFNIKNIENNMKLRNDISLADKFMFDYEHFYNLDFNLVNRLFPNFYSYYTYKNYSFKKGFLSFINNMFKKNKNIEEVLIQQAFYNIEDAVIIKLNKYSLIFNLCLNIVDIQEN
jgi:hypothetical protein